MNADEQRKALALAAQAAREMIEGKHEQKARLAKQLAALDEEITRLEVVASFDGARPKTSSPPAEGPRTRERKHDWVSIVTQLLTAAEPEGVIYIELVRVLKGEHGYRHSANHIKQLLDRMEKRGLFYRDPERRWHVKPQLTSTPVPTSDEQPQNEGTPPVIAAVREAGSWAGQLAQGHDA